MDFGDPARHELRHASVTAPEASLKLVGAAGILRRMKKYKLREVPTRRSVHVFLLAVSAFTLGEYSEKASFTSWGWAAIIASILVFALTLLLLMRDFWGADA